jgi:uncharacterized membrane protein
MQTLIHADIFFFVTTIVVVLVAIVLIVILIYIAIILADIRQLSRTIRKEGAEIAEDVDMLRQEFRHEVHQGASAASSFFRFIQGLFKKKSGRRKSKSE